MKLEKDKIYKLIYDGGTYIVKCIDEEQQYFHSLMTYNSQSNRYYDTFLKNSSEEYLTIDLLKNKVINGNRVPCKMYNFEKFIEFEYLI